MSFCSKEINLKFPYSVGKSTVSFSSINDSLSILYSIKLDFANLEVNDFLKIKFGVYAVNVGIDGDLYNGIANYGIRPTFKGEKLLLETYIFDFSKDIYGKDIVVSFIEFIREEKKFEGVDLLKKQIDMDSKKALEILGI